MTNGRLNQLGTADMWLWYDTTPEAADQRNRFRAAVAKIHKGELDRFVYNALEESALVLSEADPVWLKTFFLED